MLIKVLSAHQFIETILCFPTLLVLLFLFHFEFIFVDYRECQAQMLLGVGIEIAWVVRYVLAQLLLLKLPNVHLLVAVGEDFNTIRHIDASLKRSASVHVVNCLFIGLCEIGGALQLSHFETL